MDPRFLGPAGAERAPDTAFVTKGHADAIGRIVKYWPQAPDFAVEAVSPDDSFRVS
jgi:Uma2 family endonuclease